MGNIELVIKISEELYEAYKGRPPMLGDAGMDMIAQSIANGTPLPKGHKRLIEDDFDVGPVFDERGYRTGYRYVTQEDLNNKLTIVPADTENEVQV